MQAWRKVVTRSWLGSGVLLAAFLIHIVLALYKISRRLTWKLPFWEAAQIVSGLSIPLLLITHVVYNRGAAALAGTDDTYAYELGNIWPGLAWEHALLLLVRVGARLHRHALLAEPGALVRARAAGAVRAGRGAAGERAGGLLGGGAAGGGPDRGAGRLGEAAGARPRARCSQPSHASTRCTTGCASRSWRCSGSPCSCPSIRIVRRAAGAKVEITYRGGPMVRVPPGPTLLEISRMNDVPHASVCGGRARCSTCRVGVESGLADLMPPPARRGHDARQHHAPPHVRLACQIRPQHAITVTRLVAPPRERRGGGRLAGHPQGDRAQPGGAVPRHARIHLISEAACPTTSCSFSTACSPRWARPSSARRQHRQVSGRRPDGHLRRGTARRPDAARRCARRATSTSGSTASTRDHRRDRPAAARSAWGSTWAPWSSATSAMPTRLAHGDRHDRECREPAGGERQPDPGPAEPALPDHTGDLRVHGTAG